MRTGRHLEAAAALALVVAAACSHPAPDATPEAAVRAWLEHMEDSMGSPTEAREAFALLGPKARENLAARSVRASQVEGRRAQAFEMLAEGRFGLRFRPKSLHATVKGTDAVVDVLGDDPGTEHARVTCVKEDGAWRIEPELPDVPPPLRRRDGGA
jgi:hypothetical protein